MKQYIHYTLAALLALSVPACGSDDSAGSSVEDEPVEEQPTDPTEDPKDPPKDPPKEDRPDSPFEEPDEGWKALLLPNMATDIEVPNKSTTRLNVMLISLDGDNVGEGMVGERVKWGIETGEQSIQIASKSSTTKELGIATVTVAGTEIAGNASVIATHELSPKAVRFNIKVLDKPTGNLSVTTEYNGKAPAKNYSIRLYDSSELPCAHADLESGTLLNWTTDTEAEPLFPAIDDTSALYENLSTEMGYTIIAYGYSEEGAPVAAGCLDSGTSVHAGETTKSHLELKTIDLDPVTTYHARSYFDLGDVATELGSVGKFIKLVGDFADNPAGMMYDILMDLIVDYVGGAGKIVDWLLDTFGIEKKVKDYLNDLLTKNQTVCKVGAFACQFRDVVRLMEFMGELEVEKVGDVELRGHNAYDGLAVYWRLGCNGSDPNCGRLPITSKQLNLDTNINFLEGGWSGSIANGYDKLSVESHELKLQYGKIVVYLLNNVVFNKLTGGKANDFESALNVWINTDALANWLSNTLSIGDIKAFGFKIGSINVSQATAKGWCNSLIKTLIKIFGFASAYLELQNAGSDITISGTAMFKDTNADNFIDVINDGNWAGSMTITTKSQNDDGSVDTTKTTTAVKGIWSAYNLKNTNDDSGNMYCTYPKSSTDSADQRCSYPPIDTSKLVSSNMCGKYKACAQ